ncbi:MAG: 3-methyl-2-oxobutanoate hydroxymethyltransferase [Firmicutes bacterium]|nr:3-methyl-2-oxobutanoate hydroxymethyltransferase [Bacillota bacterium]
MSKTKTGVADLNRKMLAGEKLVMITAHDYPSAVLADRAGVDMILVSDILGPTVLGYETVIPVTMEDMRHHLKAADRGCRRAMLVAAMPFGSYLTNTEEALKNALALIQDGADAVKLEGGSEIAPLTAAFTQRGIPVMGHIGRLPQSACLWQEDMPQGRDESAAWQLVEAAQALEEAGAFAILLEWITAEVAKLISEKVDIPVIGIGSGSHCDGQLLYFQQMLGLFPEQPPHYVKKYADLAGTITQAIADFTAEVKSGAFPQEHHSSPMEEDEARKLY